MSLRSWLSLLGIYIAYLIIGMLSFRALEYCDQNDVADLIDFTVKGDKLLCNNQIIYHNPIKVSGYTERYIH